MHNKIHLKIQELIIPFQTVANKNGHRLPVVIHAEQAWLTDLGNQCLQWADKPIFIHEKNSLKANDIIGHEYELVVFNLHSSFDPNLLAAISGTLTSGGIFILLVPEKHEEHDHFYQYILKAIVNENGFLRLTVNGENIEVEPPLQIESPGLPQEFFLQQQSAVEAIKHVVTGHRKRPLTLTADRGRGKSAAIGIAIGQLISARTMNIIITAPSLVASAVIFKHIKLTQPNAKMSTSHVSFENSVVSFIAPDILLKQLPGADLLIIDEAAGHNLFTLETLLQHYSRIVFATTLHGYEGSGQGFVTRFSKTLDRITPQWKSITLDQPIRWQNNDPLEVFIDNTFMLSTEPQLPNLETEITVKKLDIRLTDIKELLTDEEQFRAIFALLKNAHYKTNPNDLRQLMNSENLILFSSYYQNTLIAATITETEGELDNNLIDDIYNGYRRPKGELLPQSIIMHLGFKEAALLRYLRIMRIAVLPDFQQQKIGSSLLSTVIEYAEKKDFDFVGCSFGATKELLNFWLKYDFRTLRVGYKKNTFSGCNAILLAKPLSDSAYKLIEKTDIAFFNNFIDQLAVSLFDLDASIVSTLFEHIFQKEKPPEITDKVRRDIVSFSQHNRSYDDNLSSIRLFLRELILNTDCFNSLPNHQKNLLILVVFQNKDWPEVCHSLNIPGKKQGLAELKSCFILLMNCCQQKPAMQR